MIRKRHTTAAEPTRALAGLAVALLAAPGAVLAQAPAPVLDYELPPSAPSPTPTAAGPVDSDHPVAAPTRPAPTPQPPPTPTPVIVLPAPTPTARAAPPRARPLSAPSASPTPAATESANLPEIPAPAPAPTATQPAPADVPATPTDVPAQAPTAPSRPADFTWAWLVGGGALALLLFGALLLRMRRKPASAQARKSAKEAEAAPTASPPATLPPAARRAPVVPPPAPEPAPAPPANERRLELSLEARHLSRAMVNATLAYRLTLTNNTDATLGSLRIAGDIISAHASLSPQDQLAPPSGELIQFHDIAALACGEAITLRGELSIPLASILPIHSGGARVFVPLARFRIEGAASGPETHVFVVGQASKQPGGALGPFPLDRGPGVDRELGQRELGLPA